MTIHHWIKQPQQDYTHKSVSRQAGVCVCVTYLRQQIKGHLRVDLPLFRLKREKETRRFKVIYNNNKNIMCVIII